MARESWGSPRAFQEGQEVKTTCTVTPRGICLCHSCAHKGMWSFRGCTCVVSLTMNIEARLRVQLTLFKAGI